MVYREFLDHEVTPVFLVIRVTKVNQPLTQATIPKDKKVNLDSVDDLVQLYVE